MGLLDRIKESEMLAAQQAQQRLLAQQQDARRTTEAVNQEAERAKSHLQQAANSFVRDTKLVTALAGNIPQADYWGYLKKVSEYTGFKYEVGIYSAPKPDLPVKHPTAETVAQVTSQRNTALLDANLVVADGKSPRSYSPETSFLGDKPQAYHTRSGFLGLRVSRLSLSEPSEPGVGIHLWKNESREERGVDNCNCSNCNGNYRKKSGTRYIDIARCVFVRISTDNQLIVTWNRSQRIQDFQKFSDLDELLDKAITDPVVTVKRKFIAYTTIRGGGGYQGNMADLDY